MSRDSFDGFSLTTPNLCHGCAADPPDFHQAMTLVLSTLSAIVIPGLVQLSYCRNVPSHEKRSLLLSLSESRPFLSQGCFPMQAAPSYPSFHDSEKMGMFSQLFRFQITSLSVCE